MPVANAQPTQRRQRTADLPGYVYHHDFDAKQARPMYDASELLDNPIDYGDRYMPDEITREHARKMHYAAHRMHKARNARELARWHAVYLGLRDCIVLGNRKLIFRAVRRRSAIANRAEDMTSDCHIVLIQAVAAYNPWLGIRFSTYAYTCLVRALSRMTQRQSADWFSRSVSLDALPDAEHRGRIGQAEPHASLQIPIEEYLREDHPLLSTREKQILSHRFNIQDDPANQTLEKVGKALGLSKERVRQVQASALDKLRRALAESRSV